MKITYDRGSQIYDCHSADDNKSHYLTSMPLVDPRNKLYNNIIMIL